MQHVASRSAIPFLLFSPVDRLPLTLITCCSSAAPPRSSSPLCVLLRARGGAFVWVCLLFTPPLSEDCLNHPPPYRAASGRQPHSVFLAFSRTPIAPQRLPRCVSRPPPCHLCSPFSRARSRSGFVLHRCRDCNSRPLPLLRGCRLLPPPHHASRHPLLRFSIPSSGAVCPKPARITSAPFLFHCFFRTSPSFSLFNLTPRLLHLGSPAACGITAPSPVTFCKQQQQKRRSVRLVRFRVRPITRAPLAFCSSPFRSFFRPLACTRCCLSPPPSSLSSTPSPVP